MRGALVAVLGLGFGGCADPGETFTPRLNLTESRGFHRVEGPGYEMDFPNDDQGLKLPTSLTLGNAIEALGPGTCPTEKLAGIAIYPAALAAGDEPGTSAFNVLDVGPALVRIAVDYRVPFSCAGQTPEMVGTTTYTFLPSNRIVRHDAVSPANMTLTTNTDCGCGSVGTTNWFFTSYWAFNTQRLVNLSGTPITGGAAPQVCAQVGTNLIALAWSPGATRTALNGTAAVFDFDVASQIDPVERNVTSAIQIGYEQGESSCMDLHRGLLDNAINVDGVMVPSDEDGLYHDTGVHTGGAFEIRADEGDVPPFGVILDIGSAQHARLSRSYGSYVIQDMGGDKHLFWFDDGLAQYESITIEPY